MTLNELSQLYWLRREVIMDARRLVELETMTNGIGGMTATGVKDRTGTTAAKIEELRNILVDKQYKVLMERNRLEQYIASVDDSHMRQILTLRFVDGDSWQKVAMEIGGNNTADSVRKACRRFIANQNKVVRFVRS